MANPKRWPSDAVLRKRYEHLEARCDDLERDRRAALDRCEELRQKLEERDRETEAESVELAKMRADYDAVREERDVFESDAETLSEDNERLRDDREVLLRLLGLSERQFEMERARLECRPDFHQLLV